MRMFWNRKSGTFAIRPAMNFSIAAGPCARAFTVGSSITPSSANSAAAAAGSWISAR
jgi:hypothetical protein